MDTGEGYVLSGGFGELAAPSATNPATAMSEVPAKYVNEGLQRWEAGREAWLGGSKDESSQEAAPHRRPRPK